MESIVVVATLAYTPTSSFIGSTVAPASTIAVHLDGVIVAVLSNVAPTPRV